ncbi:MAG: BlaI/MecI/CopY family transcriptional regulator, partial [Pirellulales bacterium]|nr:BlaI/MecI/CopY family transcriptional regulator [Pirellulales bacterium]
GERMSKRYRISEAEWVIMEAVWAHGPASASVLLEHVQAHQDWHGNTIHTMLSRLIKKGAIKAEAQGRRRVYQACVSREECVRHESRSLINRLFGGNPKQAIVHLLDDVDLDEEQRAALYRMLDDDQEDS